MYINDFEFLKENDIIEFKYYDNIYILKVNDITISKYFTILDGYILDTDTDEKGIYITFAFRNKAIKKEDVSFRLLSKKEALIYKL